MPHGYYRYPTIQDDTVVFVSEDDLWSAPAAGGVARRLTSNLGEVSHPSLSPDGEHLAYVGREEGQAEVYVMPAVGGAARRLTFLGGGLCLIAGWTQDGEIIFADNAEHWYLRFTHLYTIDLQGGQPQRLEYGLARAIAFGPQGGVILERNADEPARWKRYRGGRAGQFWIDENGDGDFRPLLPDLGNLTSPIWLGEPGSLGRVYFISDHEGVGNLYSCQPSGDDLRRHSHHEDFYARNASSDGKRIVYHAGADLYLFDPASNRSAPIEVEYHSPRVQRNRKFVDAARYLERWTLHPAGQATAITARGKLFTFANWEGAVFQLGENAGQAVNSAAQDEPPTGARYRLSEWLPDGKRLIAVSDAGGEEAFVIFNTDEENTTPETLPIMDTGRPTAIAVNPCKDQIVFSNNRYELLHLDLESHELRRIDRGVAEPIGGFDWSPDGEWVAYSVSISPTVSVLKLWNAASDEITQLTQPVLSDVAPAFDPAGRYLYFLSYRTFDPVYDNLHFELSFPLGMKPYLITLQKELPSPFIPQPKTAAPPDKEDDQNAPERGDDRPSEKASQESPDAKDGKADEEKPAEQKPVQIDLEGIQERIVAFPVSEGLFGRVLGAQDGKVLYSSYPMEGALGRSVFPGAPEAKGVLLTYDFEEQKEETLLTGISDFKLSLDGKTLIYRARNRLRVLKAGEKPKNENNDPSRKSGWLDLGRVKVAVAPGAEWRQMYREAWRLQRDQFWSEDMSQVDWLAVHDRYLPLVDRVGSRSEFSDLMWEMQGELGTSHAYEMGGDYRPEPRYQQGYLGAEFEHDPETDGWRVVHIHRGDPWDPEADSPLGQPGVNVGAGDCLVAINGQRLSRTLSPTMALVNLAGEEVTLSVLPAAREDGAEDQPPATRSVTVKTLRSEMRARYREWVEANQQRVHQASDGRIGYVHVPDMMAWGFAEFHRGFLAEAERDGLIVDVRFNRGGHVSQLILEKLARRRIGFKVARWRQVPISYPMYAVAGPLVALANEFSGSDGDIFAHSFKLMKLGPLIGRRTWGGVIGIWPRHSLVDGTVTTQPEFSNWFVDVGWNVENYGTDPDIDVEIRPQDYAQGVDSQLERAIEEALKLLQANPPVLPDFSQRPSKAAPKLHKNNKS